MKWHCTNASYDPTLSSYICTCPYVRSPTEWQGVLVVGLSNLRPAQFTFEHDEQVKEFDKYYI